MESAATAANLTRTITAQELHEAPMMKNYNPGNVVFRNFDNEESAGSRLLRKYEEGLIQTSIEQERERNGQNTNGRSNRQMIAVRNIYQASNDLRKASKT